MQITQCVAAAFCVLASSLSAAQTFESGIEQKQHDLTQPAEPSEPLAATDRGIIIFNDECLSAYQAVCNGFQVAETHIGSTSAFEPPFTCAFGGASRGSGAVWFRFVAGTPSMTITTSYPNALLPNGAFPDTLLAVYSGVCEASLVEIACNDDINIGANNLLSSLTLNSLTPGQTYHVQVAAFSATTRAPYGVSFTNCAAPNDECTGAIDIACGATANLDLRRGTTNMSDPVFACRASGSCTPGAAPSQGDHSLWYRFVPNGTHAIINTTDLDLGDFANDTLLAVYSGSCGALTQIACNDDKNCSGGELVSALIVDGLSATQVYYIEVAGWDSTEAGPFSLSINCFTQADECSFPAEIVCGQTAEADLRYTSTDPADPVLPCRADASCAPGAAPSQGANSMWFRFTATKPTVVITTVDLDPGDTANDTILAVYDGSCDALVPLACNDDIECPANLLSKIVLENLTLGNEYLIEVAAWSTGVAGLYGVQLQCLCPVECPPAATPEPELCGEDVNSGCNQMSTAVTPTTLGQIYCGTVFGDLGPDYDLYGFTCTRNTFVQWVTRCEVDSSPALLSAGCPGIAFNFATAPPCNVVRLGSFLTPGDYQAGIVPISPTLCDGASGVYLACATIAPACPGDANGDGIVSFADITSVLTFFNYNYNPFPGVGEGDANSNGEVNFADITSVLEIFGRDCFHLARPADAIELPAGSPWRRK